MANPEKEKRYTLQQGLTLVIRAFKIYASFPKPVLLSKAISCVFDAIYPFVNIYFSAQIINELAGTRDKDRLIMLGVLTVCLNLVFLFLKNIIQRWSNYCDTSRWFSIHNVLVNKLLTMDYVDIEDTSIQNKYSKIQQHQNGMGWGLSRVTRSYNSIIIGVMQIILSVTLAFSMFSYTVPVSSISLSFLNSPIAVLAVVGLLLCSVLLAPYFSIKGGKIWVTASDDNNRANRVFSFYFFHMINETGRAKDLRIYDQSGLVESQTDSYFLRVWDNFGKYNGKYGALSTAVTYLCGGLVYLYVALKALGGAFGVGSIVLYVGAITQFSAGFASVLSGIGDLFNNTKFLDNVFDFLDTPNRKYQGTLSVEKRDDNEYEIEFHNIGFKYPGNDEYALRNLNMKLHVGKRLAVVGMNGSGKTTMIKLLCRLYDPTEGEITLNGIDIKKYNYNEYMGIFSVVFQDFRLLSFSLGQNVAAATDYDREKAVDVLKKSGFEQRLSEMPKGLDTPLYKNFEEEGVEISGGEAQKIALARALYKDSPFIILDEPTAALDPIAEYEIYSKFNDIVGDKTAIFISHRLSSCRFCDDIAVFHEGRLIQRGSHDELITNESGKYFELWNAQAQYYTDKSAV